MVAEAAGIRHPALCSDGENVLQVSLEGLLFGCLLTRTASRGTVCLFSCLMDGHGRPEGQLQE